MTRMNPLRRVAATAAIAGVTGFGAVALASPALAADSTTAASTSVSVTDDRTAADAPAGTAAPSDFIHSPVPTKPIDVTIGPIKIKLSGVAAQIYQTVEANLYAAQGYQITFTKDGVLAIGKKVCDPTRSADWNKGCVLPNGPRF